MAIVLGGDGVDAALAIGPSIVVDRLLFYTDAANSDSLITKNKAPLVQNVEIENVLNLVGAGSLDVSSANYIVPTYSTGSRGTLFTGTGGSSTDNTILSINPDINIGTTGTIDIWASPLPGGGRWVYGLTAGRGNTFLLDLTLGTTTLSIGTDDRNYNNQIVSLSKNKWYNIVLVFNGPNSKLYVNGQESPATSGANQSWWTGTGAIPNYTVTTVGYPLASLYSGDGYLGPFRLYSKNLSSQEVLQNYNAMKSRYTI